MNKLQLKQLIREEIKRSLEESVNESERQLRDPKKEMLIVKDGKLEVSSTYITKSTSFF